MSRDRFPVRSVYSVDRAAKAAESRRFAKILCRVLVVEKRHDMRTVARDMGCSYPTLSAYCTGRLPFPLERLHSLLYATRHDPAFGAELLGADVLRWAIAELPEATSPGDVRGHALRAGAAIGEFGVVADEVISPTSDGGEAVTEPEMARAKAAKQRAERELETAARALEMRRGGAR